MFRNKILISFEQYSQYIDSPKKEQNEFIQPIYPTSLEGNRNEDRPRGTGPNQIIVQSFGSVRRTRSFKAAKDKLSIGRRCRSTKLPGWKYNVYRERENVTRLDSRFAHSLRPTRKPNTLEREMVGNSCRGQIYSVFSTIAGDAWHASPRIIPIPHRFIAHRHCFVCCPLFLFSRGNETHVSPLPYTLSNTKRFRVSHIACAHESRYINFEKT